MTSGPSTRRQRVQQREEAIVVAAHEVFSELGFDGATIAGIARRADVAEGTIYLYFKNKNALLQAVLGSFYARLTDGAARGVDAIRGTRKRLEFLARHHLEHCLTEWRILQLMMGLYRHVPDYENPEHYRFNKTYVSVFDRIVRDGIELGDLQRDITLPIIRDLFYGGLEYSARTHLLRGGNADEVDAIADRLVALVWQGACRQDQNRQRPEIDPSAGLVERLESLADRLEKHTDRIAPQHTR